MCLASNGLNCWLSFVFKVSFLAKELTATLSSLVKTIFTGYSNKAMPSVTLTSH